MIGKVVEGRFSGCSICKQSESNLLFIETEDGSEIALSKRNIISIDDISESYSSGEHKVLMVIWNDFETSVLQLGETKHFNDTIAKTKAPITVLDKSSRKDKGHKNKHFFYKFSIIILILLVLSFISLYIYESVLQKDCGFCGADGNIRCSVCKSSGKIDCSQCNTKGRLYCEGCRGLGDIKCSDCNSVGYTNGETCPECKGDGRTITSLDLSDVGSSELLSKVYRNRKRGIGGFWSYTCNTCDGSGIERFDCKTCSGNGRYTCPECDGNHFGDTCPDCIGTTKVSCKNCDGSGLLSCDKCDGNGKRFIWD